MIKPVWKSKKCWAAALSLLGVVVAHYTGNPQIALGVIVLGSALLTAIGLADLGKEGRAIEAASWEAVPPPPAPRSRLEDSDAVEAVDTPDPED